MSSKRIFIISLDGATWDVLLPLADNGIMPYLKTLIEGSFIANLKSVIPPVTAPAWTSFMTGKTPGKHGIFDFRNYDANSRKDYITNSSHNQSKTIWEILSDFGKKVIVLNLPYTYPPPEVNGIIVSGFDIPSLDLDYTYPKEIKREIFQRWPEYAPAVSDWSIDLVRNRKKATTYIEKLIQSLRLRAEIALYFAESKEWDIFMIHFQETDYLQHVFWDLIYGGVNKIVDPLNKLSQHIRNFFIQLDNCLRDIIHSIKQDHTILFLLSDHGFGEHKGTIFPNVFLKEHGYLRQVASKLLPGEDWVAKNKRAIKNFIYRTNSQFLTNSFNIFRDFISAYKNKEHKFRLWMENEKLKSDIEAMNIDWSQTMAFMATGDQCAFIYFNKDLVNNKEKHNSLTKELKVLFESSKHPETGELLFKEALTPMEAYGRLEDSSVTPDLILIPQDGFSVSRRVSPDIVTKNNYPGLHREKGVLIINGQDVKKSRFELTPQLIDVAPTILYLLNLPIPYDMDGNVLTDVLVEKYKIDFSKESSQRYQHAKTYTEEEERLVKERLKNLGYLG